ncbi:hypothetical protein HDU76_001760 [Blyttiomyces sp. JEL0837]|nr:hypothetical protein HDU76_001760 [Blyttiomyces sp. JEL0837]
MAPSTPPPPSSPLSRTERRQEKLKAKKTQKGGPPPPDPELVQKEQDEIAEHFIWSLMTGPCYSFAFLIPMGILMAGGRWNEFTFNTFFWGSFGWYLTLAVRMGVKSIVTYIPFIHPFASVTFIMGFVESTVRFLLLHFYPGNPTFGRVISFGTGWTSLIASLAIIQRNDERAIEAKRRMAINGAPHPLSISPVWSVVERLGEGMMGLGLCCVVGASGWFTPHAAVVQGLGMYATRVWFKGSTLATEGMVLFGFFTLWNGLYLIGFMPNMKLFIFV